MNKLKNLTHHHPERNKTGGTKNGGTNSRTGLGCRGLRGVDAFWVWFVWRGEKE